MTEKALRVSMPDGSKWDVPLRLVAQSYVDYYQAETVDDALRHDDTLIYWAENIMNWDEVADKARIAVQPPHVEKYQDGWMNGEKEIVSHD